LLCFDPAGLSHITPNDLACVRTDDRAAELAASPGLMANRRSEKERVRQQRLARERAREERAKRRERQIYIGVGAGLLVLAQVTAVIVSSRGSSTPRLPPAAPSSQAVPSATSAASGGSTRVVLTANVRQANQILDVTIQAKVAQLPGVPVVINQWASWCTNCRLSSRSSSRPGARTPAESPS
jgi:hypothetical protein